MAGMDQSAATQAQPAVSDANPEVTAVTVSGVRALLGDKIPLDLQDTPQSVNLIPQKLIQEQADHRLEDALKNVPGVTLNAGEGAARGDTVNIRGFSAFNDFFLDGVRDAAVYNRDSFDMQEVEVLKGPSATLFGRGSTGGAINQVSKAPGLDAFRTLTSDVGTNDEVRSALDIDQPLGPASAVRLNAMAETSGVAGRNVVRNRRWGVAPSAAFGLGGATTVTLNYMHLQEDDTPDSGVPFVNGLPAPVPRGSYYGLASDRAKSWVDVGTLRLTHEVSPAVTFTSTVRYASYRFDYQFHAPNFGSPGGLGGAPGPSTALSSVLVGRDSPSSSGAQTNLTGQFDLTARFVTGPLRHVLVAGKELARETNDLDRYVNPFNQNNFWIAPTPLLNPDPFVSGPIEPVSATQVTDANSEAVYATDTASLGRHLDLIAGVRLDRFAATYHQVTVASGAVLDLAHVDKAASPRLAAVFKPVPWESLYVSYGTSFDPSAEALTLTTKTANLGPVKSTSYEAGSKTSVFSGGLLLTAAVFHIEVNNAQINDPDNPTLTVLEGNERVQGFELGATGHIAPSLEITAGYTYLDGKTSGAASTGPYSNVAVPNLAPNAFNLWAEYELSHTWEFGAGLNYLGNRAANIVAPGNPLATVPSYVVFNAMAACHVSDRLTLQLNALNLGNRLYYDGVYYTSASENHVLPGPGRTVKLTARVSF
ncbi:MAG TPA: TonB-dependent siderophore receptor [Caulobacteraceae bacterium]|jgi:catecholate siderophore receptor